MVQYPAVYMMGESRKGVSANQLKRMLGVSYKTAWYLCHRIRAAMKDPDPMVRAQAARSAGMIGDAAIIPDLKALAGDPDDDRLG